MTISSTLDVIKNEKDYCQIATNTFQEYANEDFEGKLLEETIKINFKH